MSRSVLFVEDEAVLRTIYQRQTVGLFDVDVAASPAEALLAIQSKNYAVIVTDLSMPGMDGVELAKLAKRQIPRAVRILLTGHSEWPNEPPPKGLLFRVLTKPCPRELLLSSLEAAINSYEADVDTHFDNHSEEVRRS